MKNTEGLYGRLTDRIQLKPFSLSECEEYASRLGLGFTRQEVTDAYMIFGGVPYYWSLMNPRLSLAQNVDELVFAADGKLRDEYRYLYASIFRNAEMHVKVVEALAEKKCGMSREEIIQATGLKNGENFKILPEELEQCNFIRSYVPFGRKNRGTIYQLIDNFTLFYHTFLAHAASETTPTYFVPSKSSVVRAAGFGHTKHAWRSSKSQRDSQETDFARLSGTLEPAFEATAPSD